MPDEQDDQTTDDQSSDQSTQEQSDQEPADSDQPSAQSDDAPADSDQSAEQSEEEQPTAETDQAVDQSEEQPAGESDQPADQSEEQPPDSDHPEEQPPEGDQTAAQAEESPGDTDQAAEQSGEEPAEADGVAAQAGKQPADTTQTKQQPTGGAQPAGQTSAQTTQSPAPKRPYRVESWRPLVTEMAGDIPVEVLLRWIKRESNGDPCATGAPAPSGGGSIENGIFQLYSPDHDHLATPAQLHGSFCSGKTCIRDLTLEEARIQVASGIASVDSLRNLARAHLKGAGAVWEEVGSGFWSLVKMEHNSSVVCRDYLKNLRPTSWSEFKAGVLKNPSLLPQKYSGSGVIDGLLSLAEDIGAGAV